MNNRLPNLESVPPSLGVLRLIITALTIGLCVIGGTILFSAQRIGGKLIAEPAVVYAVIAFAVIAIILQSMIPKLRAKPIDLDETALLRCYGSEVLIRAGIVEAAAILTFIVYLLAKDELIIYAGIGLVITQIFLRPSLSSYQRWRERQVN